MKRVSPTSALLLGLVFLSGCAATMSNRTYAENEALQPMAVEYGTVASVQPVTFQATPTGLGPLAGAVIGGAAGNSIGGGNGRIISTVGGAILGGLAGAAAENNASRQNGQQITVRMDDDRLLAVVQGGRVVFAPGERVQLLTAPDGTTRVAAAPPAPR